jgi:hypothetical protein
MDEGKNKLAQSLTNSSGLKKKSGKKIGLS